MKRHFKLNKAAFEKFMAVLNAPLEPNEALKRLFEEPTPWDDAPDTASARENGDDTGRLGSL